MGVSGRLSLGDSLRILAAIRREEENVGTPINLPRRRPRYVYQGIL
jgi:hypothetical protein